jgi:hypothetical protein
MAQANLLVPFYVIPPWPASQVKVKRPKSPLAFLRQAIM